MAMQAMDRPTASMVVNLCRNSYVLIPIMYLMNGIFGMMGIVWAMPISDIISIVISIFVLKHTIKSCFSSSPQASSNVLNDEGITSEQSNGKTNYIITIGRSYGAGGRSVGKLVAKELGIPFYDKMLMKETAEKSGLSRQYLESVDETASLKNRSGVYTNIYTTDQYVSVESTAYQAQKEVLEKIASEGACVIVGRSATNKI